MIMMEYLLSLRGITRTFMHARLSYHILTLMFEYHAAALQNMHARFLKYHFSHDTGLYALYLKQGGKYYILVDFIDAICIFLIHLLHYYYDIASASIHARFTLRGTY